MNEHGGPHDDHTPDPEPDPDGAPDFDRTPDPAPDHTPDPAHGHDAAHGHAHGHPEDRGLSGFLRYLRFANRMWQSDINRSVIDLVDPRHGERVVDIGAGMGAGTVLAARRGAAVDAVEPTPFMRRILAARRWLQSARKRIAVHDGAAEALPVPDDAADAVWSVNAMHHWVDPVRAAAEIRRVVRPGGRVVLVDEDFEDPSHPDHEQFMGRHGSGHEDHGFTMVEADQMGRILTEAGLVEVEAGARRMAGRPVIAVTAAG